MAEEGKVNEHGPAPPRGRFVSFYIDEVWSYQTKQVVDRLQLKNRAGKVVSSFPKTGKEAFSWYLCDCTTDPTAHRANSPAQLGCRVCKREEAALSICSCGIVSPLREDRQECLWCGRACSEVKHRCREIKGASVAVAGDLSDCPICKWRPQIEAASPPPAKEPVAELPPKAIEQKAMRPAETEPVVEPVPPPPPVEPRDRKRPDRKDVPSPSPWFKRVVAAVVVLAVFGLIYSLAVLENGPGPTPVLGSLRVTVVPAAYASLDDWRVPDGGQKLRTLHEFTDLEPRTWKLTVWRDRNARTERKVVVEAGNTADVEVSLVP